MDCQDSQCHSQSLLDSNVTVLRRFYNRVQLQSLDSILYKSHSMSYKTKVDCPKFIISFITFQRYVQQEPCTSLFYLQDFHSSCKVSFVWTITAELGISPPLLRCFQLYFMIHLLRIKEKFADREVVLHQ